MTVTYSDQGYLVYVDKEGKETEIDVHSSYCEACWNTHLWFKIPDFNFETDDISYFGDMEYFDDFDQLNEEIEEHLKEQSHAS